MSVGAQSRAGRKLCCILTSLLTTKAVRASTCQMVPVGRMSGFAAFLCHLWQRMKSFGLFLTVGRSKVSNLKTWVFFTVFDDQLILKIIRQINRWFKSSLVAALNCHATASTTLVKLWCIACIFIFQIFSSRLRWCHFAWKQKYFTFSGVFWSNFSHEKQLWNLLMQRKT